MSTENLTIRRAEAEDCAGIAELFKSEKVYSGTLQIPYPSRDNDAAIHLYERFGFEVEGTLRQHAFRDGMYVDSKIMARLKSKQQPES